jgi:hypothetical protein
MTCKKCEGHVEHIRGLEAENKRLRDIKLVRFNGEDCWLWQGDGFDYPDSLSCPVVMSADTLRALLANNDSPVTINMTKVVEKVRNAQIPHDKADDRTLRSNGFVL